MTVEPPVKAHRLGNYAQVYESLKTLVRMDLARSILTDWEEENFSGGEIEEQLGQAEMDFWDAIRAFHQTNGDDPDIPVLINGTLYLALHAYEHHIIRIEPVGITDVVHGMVLDLRDPT